MTTAARNEQYSKNNEQRNPNDKISLDSMDRRQVLECVRDSAALERAGCYMRERFVRSKAVSPLRSATALQDAGARIGRGGNETGWNGLERFVTPLFCGSWHARTSIR